jgi:hypothetical protein
MGKRKGKPLIAATAAAFLAATAATAATAAAGADGGTDPQGRWTLSPVGSAPTPPMGWNSWNAFHLDITEAKIVGSARALVDTGLAAAGYRSVNIDDGWWLKRRQPDGRMIVRTNVFPSAAAGGADTSLRPFTDRIHAMGLRAGIYSDIGRNAGSQSGADWQGPTLPAGSVAEREVGLYGHVAADVQLFFGDWNFDYIKVDGCGIANYGADRPTVRAGHYRPLPPLIDFDQVNRTDVPAVRALYAEVRDALKRVRPRGDYAYSLCLWGSSDVRRWGEDVGTIWRTSRDIDPSWGSMIHNFDTVATRELYAGPGRWNDPDMLEVGNGFFDADHLVQARAHMTLWAIEAAPLLIGTDLTTASPAILDVLRAPEVVAVDQDPAGNQGVLAYTDDERQIVVRTLADGRKAVALVNRTAQPTRVTLSAAHLKMRGDQPVRLRDLWARRDLAPFTGEQEFPLQPFETRLLAAAGPSVLGAGYYLSEQPARIHVAADGVPAPAPDPTIHRTVAPADGPTTGGGERPVYAGWGAPRADATPYAGTIRIAGRAFPYGLGLLAGARLEVLPAPGSRRFEAMVGIDDATPAGASAARFELFGDGRRLAASAPKRVGEAPEPLAADVTGVRTLELVVRPLAGTAPAVVAWGDARLMP